MKKPKCGDCGKETKELVQKGVKAICINCCPQNLKKAFGDSTNTKPKINIDKKYHGVKK